MRNEVFTYNNNPITFQMGNGDVMVNATEMAKPFNKYPNEYLRLPSTNELIMAITGKSRISDNQIVRTVQGSSVNGGGTWLHEDIALDFAQWLSVDFKLWCNDRIKELLRTGVTTISNDDEVIARAMTVLQTRLEDAQREKQILQVQSDNQQQQLEQVAPKVEYYNKVLTSKSTYTANQIAKELGWSAITLNRKLRAKGVQYLCRGQWVLYAKYQDRGYTKTITHTFTHSNGTTGTSMLTVFTEAGRLFIHALFAQD